MQITNNFYLTGESYRLWIETNPEVVSVSAYNVQEAPLSIRFWLGEGIGKASISAYLTLAVETAASEVVVEHYRYNSPGTVTGYDYTLPENSYPTANRISVYAYEDAARTNLMASKQVNIVAKDATPFPVGDSWESTRIYKNGEYILLENVLYMWSSRVSGNTYTDPKTWIQNHPNDGQWTVYPYNKLLAAQIFLANFALIGSAVFQDEYMISQKGTDTYGNPSTDYRNFTNGTFSPNLMLDFLRGVGTFSGFIKKVVTIVNQSNFNDYFEYVPQWEAYAPYNDRLASYVELTGIPSDVIITLPFIYASRVLWPNWILQDARANVGNSFILNNKSGSAVTILGCANSTDEILTNTVLNNGDILHAKCTAMIYQDMEAIVWNYIKVESMG